MNNGNPYKRTQPASEAQRTFNPANKRLMTKMDYPTESWWVQPTREAFMAALRANEPRLQRCHKVLEKDR